MFSNLQEKLSKAFSVFRNKGKLSEADVKEGMREVKLALLEADVSYKVVKEFVGRVSERAVGAEVMESLLPAQQIVKIVNEELIAVMGGENAKLEISPKPPTVILMCGLQGAGKTTHCAKLASYFKKKGKSPLLVACDIYRPAAVDQLKTVGAAVNIPVFSMGTDRPAVEIARSGVEYAVKNCNDMVFIDTAGRLHVDDALMDELKDIKDAVNPTEVLLVVDAMTGQDAVNVAQSFNEKIGITGCVLTKLDGDTRGGAALSVRYITGKPIKFIGTGEKLDMLEPFYPDRLASRILGMGDVLTLIEKAEQAIDQKKAAELEQKLRSSTFTLSDYLEQLDSLKNMGDLDQLAGMIPGMKAGALKNAKIDENAMSRTKAIILSMTEKERNRPDVINSSRKKRIAAGSGTTVEEVNKLLRQFEQMNKLMKQFTGKGAKRFKGMMGMPF